MDVLGVAMGFVTIPMAMLSVASAIAMLGLLVTGSGSLVAIGLVAIAVGVALAHAFERIAIALDTQAWATLRRSGRGIGMAIGIASAVLPMLALLAWQFGCFALIVGDRSDAPVLRWLWSYGVATGPWTLFALRVGSDRRTLCGIRAYAGHLGYWLFSASTLILNVPATMAAWSMALPAVLPLIVGTLLAVADRDALKNVRI